MRSQAAFTDLKVFPAALTYVNFVFLSDSSSKLKPHSGKKVCRLKHQSLVMIRFCDTVDAGSWAPYKSGNDRKVVRVAEIGNPIVDFKLQQILSRL